MVNLAGKTNFYELGYLLMHYSALLLSVDSSIMHLASYLGLPIVALFGPTDQHKYGPFSLYHKVLANNCLNCRPCEKAECKREYECMRGISPYDVVAAVKEMLTEDGN